MISMYVLYVQGKVDTKNQQPPKYSVVDKSKKTKKKVDKPQKVYWYIYVYTHMVCM